MGVFKEAFFVLYNSESLDYTKLEFTYNKYGVAAHTNESSVIHQLEHKIRNMEEQVQIPTRP